MEKVELEILLTFRKETKQKNRKVSIRENKLAVDRKLYTIPELQSGSHISEEKSVWFPNRNYATMNQQLDYQVEK